MEFSRQFFLDLIEVTRLKIQVASLSHAVLGALISLSSLSQLLDTSFFVYVVLTYVLISFSCHTNCLYDVDVDLRYKKYMGLAVKRLGEGFMKKLILFDVLLSVVLIIYLIFKGKYITGVLAIAGAILAWIYSAPPVRAKAKGTAGFLPVFIGLYSFPILGGWFLFRTDINPFLILFVLFYALMNEGITFVNTAEDHREDFDEGIRTISHRIGVKNLLILASFMTLTGAAGTSFLLAKKFMWLENPASLIFSLITFGMGTFISFKILKSSRSGDPELETKKIAPNMGKWFLATRYPLIFSALAGLIYTQV